MIRALRHKRIRAKIQGTVERPRLSVFRSLKGIWAQLIDDATGNTLVAANHKELKTNTHTNKIEQSRMVGKLLAEKAQIKNITAITFDRGGYKYHGRIKALAEGAREGGLIF